MTKIRLKYDIEIMNMDISQKRKLFVFIYSFLEGRIKIRFILQNLFLLICRKLQKFAVAEISQVRLQPSRMLMKNSYYAIAHSQ